MKENYGLNGFLRKTIRNFAAMLRIITEICIICNEVAKFRTQKI